MGTDLITDCSGHVAEIQCLLMSLEFIDPDEHWARSHPIIRQWLPEYEQYGRYCADFDDLAALADALRGIHSQSVAEWLQRAK